MSEINKVPGGIPGPGGIEEKKPEETQSSERGARFRKVAKRLREKQLQELEAALQQRQKNAGLTGEQNIESLRRNQIQPGNKPGTQDPDLLGAFGPKNTPARTGPQGPSLLDAFKTGKNADPVTNKPAQNFFKPTFMSGVSNTNTATGGASPLNPMFFATPETANWLIMQKLPQLGFPGATAIMKQSGSNGGPFVANQQELWIRLPDGTEFNAGLLADYYTRNPEDKFPGLADKYAKDVIAAEINSQAGKNRS